jgi:hypothetical protein
MADTKPARAKHEGGNRHKQSVEDFVSLLLVLPMFHVFRSVEHTDIMKIRCKVDEKYTFLWSERAGSQFKEARKKRKLDHQDAKDFEQEMKYGSAMP